MDLCVRPAEPADFPACAALPCGGLAYTRIGPADLIRAWTRLLADDALIACVAEDRDLPPEPRLVGFAATVFVSDAWVRAAGASSEPYLAARTLAADEARRTPVLRPREVDATNRGHGVNILNLHYAEHPQLGREDAVFLRHQMMQSFLAEFRGYHVRDVIQEFWDEIEPEFILNGWGRVRNDYAVWHGKRTGSADPAARRPYLVGFSRTEAQALPGDVMASLFVHLPSRFAFSIAEKRLLQHARHGLTDSELATTMGVALPTIKSQWRAVYARVARVAPGLLGDTRTEHLQSIHRGQEKRRRLLRLPATSSRGAAAEPVRAPARAMTQTSSPSGGLSALSPPSPISSIHRRIKCTWPSRLRMPSNMTCSIPTALHSTWCRISARRITSMLALYIKGYLNKTIFY